jgi:hypothetical protein
LPLRRYEGPSIEDLLAKVRREGGGDARITDAQRVRKGGIAGFFSREVYQLTVAVPDRPPRKGRKAPRDPVSPDKPPAAFAERSTPVHDTSTPGTPGRDPAPLDAPVTPPESLPAGSPVARTSLLGAYVDASEDIDSADGSAATLAATLAEDTTDLVQLSTTAQEAHPTVGDDSGEQRAAWENLFGTMLSEAAATMQVEDARPLELADDPLGLQSSADSVEPSSTMSRDPAPPEASEPPETREGETPAPPPLTGIWGASPLDDDAEIDLDGEVDEDGTIVVDTPGIPVAEHFSDDAAAGRSSTREDRSHPGGGLGATSAGAIAAFAGRATTVGDALGLSGFPLEMIPASMNAAWSRDTLTEALADLPVPPPLPTSPGDMLAVVGNFDSARRIASALATDSGLSPGDVVLASPDTDLALPEGVEFIGSVNDATVCQRNTATATHHRVVVVDAPLTQGRRSWVGRVLDALDPTMVLGVVDASVKPEDICAWAADIGGIDVLALDGLAATCSPGSAFACGLPVALLDGEAATPARWASLVAERMAPAALERGTS